MLGVIMLDTIFPRFPGDIGNKDTFDFPVSYEVVKGAIPKRVVWDADRDLIIPFIRAAQRLENDGARLITTSCGFLALFQGLIAKEVGVPFISSSLIQVPLIYSMLGKEKKVGILTADAGRLTGDHFKEAGAGNIPLVVHGMEAQEEFYRVFVGNSPKADYSRLQREVGEVASRFAGQGDIGAVVLECTNLPPYEDCIRRAAGLPVFHLNSLIKMVYSSI